MLSRFFLFNYRTKSMFDKPMHINHTFFFTLSYQGLYVLTVYYDWINTVACEGIDTVFE